MIKKFNAYEQPGKSVVFAFGRFNPPTTGHEKLINKVKQHMPIYFMTVKN